MGDMQTEKGKHRNPYGIKKKMAKRKHKPSIVRGQEEGFATR